MASPADGKLAGKAQLRISLSRLSFGPGELVQGHVELLVAETVVCSGGFLNPQLFFQRFAVEMCVADGEIAGQRSW